MTATPIHQGRAFYAGLLEAMIQVMGTAKGYLFHHGPRVAVISQRIGARLELSSSELARLFFASVLADTGMIGLVEDAWENPVPVLPPDERSRVQEHPLRGEKTVRRIPYLGGIAPLVRHHHEWWDGSGYPEGLSGEEIPLGAQILRLADTAAALGEERPQRPALSHAEIRREMEKCAGRECSPELTEHFLQLLENGQALGFHPALFQRTLFRAARDLLPDEVSPLTTDELLYIFSSMVDAKDRYTAGHSRRVAKLGAMLAEHLGLDEDVQATVWAAGHLHDVGKVSVPLRVLSKPGPLSRKERREVQRHTTAGASILASVPSLRHLTTGARYHHERWDGSGYPEGLSRDRIPVVAQILAICDAYDAMTSDRSYREARSHEVTMSEISREAGSHFAPRVADAFLDLPEESVTASTNPGAPSLFDGTGAR